MERERTIQFLMAVLLTIGMSCLAHADALGLLKAGLAARIRGDFGAAVKLYTQAIDTGSLSDANRAVVLASRGVAYDMIGETDRAIDDFDTAIRLAPDRGTTYIYRGLAWAKRREFSRAIVDFNEAIRRDPSYAFLALNNLGNVDEEIGEHDRAIENYGRAIELNPGYVPAYYNRAGAHYAKADYDQAIEDYGRAIQLKPNYADAFNNRGVAYLAKGAVDKAIADFGAAIRLNPNNVAAVVNRGHFYAAHGQFELADVDFSSAIKLKPDIGRLYVDRGRAKLYLGQTEAAISDLTTAIRLNPSDIYAVIWLHLTHVRATVDDLHELKRNSANIDHKKWPGPIVDLHLGTTNPETVSTAGLSNIDTKARPERVCEVEFYLGTFYLEHDDRVEAKRRLEAAANACPRSLIERGAAKVELIRLQSIRSTALPGID
jgi:tetratricopeptide (TPR) repeat protein